jgi:hypothetical protein
MSFITVLTIFFASPLYFVIGGKWVGLIFNSILYLIAVACLISIVGAIVAPFFWIFSVAHGMWNLRREAMEEQASIMAQKMAAAISQPHG